MTPPPNPNVPAPTEPPRVAVDLDGDGTCDRDGWDAGRDGDVRYIAVHDPLPPPEPILLSIPNLLARRGGYRTPRTWWVVVSVAASVSFALGVLVGSGLAVTASGTPSTTLRGGKSAALLAEWLDEDSMVRLSLTDREIQQAERAIDADKGDE